MKVTIADYGVGNLYSISKGLERSGARIELVSDMERLLSSDCIVFPGVGAFGAAMSSLEPILPQLRKKLREGTPALGICLGMQILFQKSEESVGEGIGVLGGEVKKLRTGRVPQMGWNDVVWTDDALFVDVTRGSQFYFANSYVCCPSKDVGVAYTDYGERFPSAVRDEAICGVQFHPEKSGGPGLRVLSNFLDIAEGAQ